MVNDESCVIFYMTQAAHTLEIACDSRKQKLYHVNQPLHVYLTWLFIFIIFLTFINNLFFFYNINSYFKSSKPSA